MGKDVVTKEEFIQLLYEVTDAYEREIKSLKQENKRLELMASGSISFAVFKKMEYVLSWCCDIAMDMGKRIIILLGCKEYLKGTKVYIFYKSRVRR